MLSVVSAAQEEPMRTGEGLVLAMLVTSCALGGTAPAGLNGNGAPSGDPGASGSPGSSGGDAGASGPASGPELALATSLPASCAGPEIVRIDRPIAANDPTKGHFSYGFRFKAPTSPGAPVLVYLPGGPGMTSIDTIPTFLPSGWGYLLTDPRGVGCNALAGVPSDDVASVFWRSEELAADSVAAIADRRLDAYVLFGLS